MKRFLLIAALIFLLIFNSFAVGSYRYWVGPAGGLWSASGNWSLISAGGGGAGAPAITDTAVFDQSFAGSVNVDVNVINIAALDITTTSTVIFSPLANRNMSIGNIASALRVFFVESGSTLILGSGGFSVSIQTYGNGFTTSANIDGTLVIGDGNSVWTVNQFPVNVNLTGVVVKGLIRVASTNTSVGGVLVNGTVGTVVFQSGSEFRWQRDGDAGPVANFQSGSIIRILGVKNTMMSFSSQATYNGTLIWNCTTQVAGLSGSAAVLLPAPNSSMGSVQVISTGVGTLRMATEPAGYTLYYLEVDGGTVELSSPVIADGNASITTGLVISGGTVKGNATFIGDGGTAHSMTLTVNAGLAMTGGSLVFSERPISNLPEGTFYLIVSGIVSNVNQVNPSSIIAGTAFIAPQQDSLIVNGSAAQTLQLDNITGNINLKIANSSGVNMGGNISLPYRLILAQGYLATLNNTLTVGSTLITQLAVLPEPKVVTNGTGFLKLTGISGTGNFYIGPSSTTYNPVVISSGSGNDFSARVETGINNPGVAIPTDAVLRTWYIKASAATSGVIVTYQYKNSECSPGAQPQPKTMEILQSDFTTWSLVPGNNSILSVASGSYFTVTSVAGMNISSSFIPYAVGVSGTIILTSDYFVTAHAQKINNSALISWKVADALDVISFEIQRSVNNSGFQTIGVVNPVANQTDFSFTDAALSRGTNLYRIKVNRLSGSTKYSNTVAVIYDSNDLLITSVAPNPVHSSAILTLSTAKPGGVDFKVYNMTGSLVKQWHSNIAEGNNTIEMNVAELPAGMYHVLASTINARTVSRFVKQ